MQNPSGTQCIRAVNGDHPLPVIGSAREPDADNGHRWILVVEQAKSAVRLNHVRSGKHTDGPPIWPLRAGSVTAGSVDERSAVPNAAACALFFSLHECASQALFPLIGVGLRPVSGERMLTIDGRAVSVGNYGPGGSSVNSRAGNDMARWL
jgi:hypothetical protein